MSQWSESKPMPGEELSSLMDGELEPAAVALACARWRDDGQARAQWHAYHLIGDVLRSEDLASDQTRDVAFITELRKRLATEPVVLAPSPVAVPAPVAVLAKRRRAWATPAAVAAGFMVVAGALVVTQIPRGESPADSAQGSALAENGLAAGPVLVADGKAASAAAAQAVGLDGRLIRDARLDEYLAAHKRFGGSSVSGGPSGFLQKAAVEAEAR